jgi:hypothetical protein
LVGSHACAIAGEIGAIAAAAATAAAPSASRAQDWPWRFVVACIVSSLVGLVQACILPL